MELPESISLPILAAQRQKLRGHYMLSEMPRLPSHIVPGASDQVSFSLAFRYCGRSIRVNGEISWSCVMLCQRCMQDFRSTIKNDINWQTAADWQSARQLAVGVEPLPAGEKPLKLRDLIEDEVLLGLPASPMHPWNCQLPGKNKV